MGTIPTGQKPITGFIKEVSGKVEAISVNGEVRELKVGDAIYAGDKILSAAGGNAVIEFADGRQCAISENTSSDADALMALISQSSQTANGNTDEPSFITALMHKMFGFGESTEGIIPAVQCLIPPQQPQDQGDSTFVLLPPSPLRGDIYSGYHTIGLAIHFEPLIQNPEELLIIGQPLFPTHAESNLALLNVVAGAGNVTTTPENVPQPSLPPEADLTVVKTASDYTPELNSQGHGMEDYTITVTNAGPDAADNVVVTDQLPSDLMYISSSDNVPGSTIMFDLSDNTLTWTIPAIDFPQGGPNDTLHILAEILSLPPAITEVTTGHDGDGDSNVIHDWSNVTLTAFNFGTSFVNGSGDLNLGAANGTTAYNADGVGVAGTHSDIPGQIADEIEFDPNTNQTEALVVDLQTNVTTATVQVSHLFNDENVGEYGEVTLFTANGTPVNGTDANSSYIFGESQYGVVAGLSNFIPLNYQAGSDNIGSFTVANATPFEYLVFTALPYGAGAVPVNPATTTDSSDYYVQQIIGSNPGTISNTATVTSTTFDNNSGNNSSTVTVTPQSADLEVTKVVNDATPNVNNDITYVIQVNDNGMDSAQNVTVQDLLPTGLTFVSDATSTGSYDANDGIWSIGNLAAGQIVQLSVTAEVNGSVLGAVTNTATVSSTTYDPISGNNSSSVTINPQYADLTICKTVCDATPTINTDDTFTISVTNQGPDASNDVVITDPLPAGLILESYNDNGVGTVTESTNSVTGQETLTWTIPTIVDAAIDNLSIVTKVDSTTAPLTEALIITGASVTPSPGVIEDTWNDVTLSAYNFGNSTQFVQGGLLDLTSANGTAFNNGTRVGVNTPHPFPNSTQTPGEIQYNPTDAQTEALAVTLPTSVVSATISVSNLFSNENVGEYGEVTLFTANDTPINGTVANSSYIFGKTPTSGTIPANFIAVNYNGSVDVGSFTVTSTTAFEYMVFTALPYGGGIVDPSPNITTDSSDYYVTQITGSNYATITNTATITTTSTYDPSLGTSSSASVTPQPQTQACQGNQCQLTTSHEQHSPQKCAEHHNCHNQVGTLISTQSLHLNLAHSQPTSTHSQTQWNHHNHSQLAAHESHHALDSSQVLTGLDKSANVHEKGHGYALNNNHSLENYLNGHHHSSTSNTPPHQEASKDAHPIQGSHNADVASAKACSAGHHDISAACGAPPLGTEHHEAITAMLNQAHHAHH
jgi:uncharacterized repeat protein (TIGR01451 family)